MPAYKELYSVGTEVLVVSRERLEDFRRTWRYHHALQEEQLPYAGSVARVGTAGFYHGGDVLWRLADIPCIRARRSALTQRAHRMPSSNRLEGTVILGCVAAGAERKCAPAALIGRLWAAPQLQR